MFWLIGSVIDEGFTVKNSTIFLAQSLWDYHLGIELELIQRLVNEDQILHVVICGGELPTCQANPEHIISKCKHCKYRTSKALKQINGSFSIHRLSSLIPKDIEIIQRKNIPHDLKIADLKDFQISDIYRDFSLGLSSSLLSRFRDTGLRVAAKEKLLWDLAQASIIFFYAFQELCKHFPINITYLFNGRFSEYRSLMRSSQALGISFITYERGSDVNKFELYPGVLPHDYKNIYNCASLLSQNSPWEEVEEEGGNWFRYRRRGIAQEWLSYSRDQSFASLPKNYNNGNRNIIIYNSSEDEFAAIGPDYANPLFKDQMDALEKVAELLSKIPNCNVFLRVHPNLSNFNNDQTTRMLSISHKNFYIIPADDPISSYSLLSNAWKVITFGSQMGIEAVFWGVPSILVGRSRFCLFDGLYIPKTIEELSLLLVQELSPKSKKGAIEFGYYFKTFGINYKYFMPTAFYTGTFKGWKMVNSAFENLQNIVPGIYSILKDCITILKWFFKKVNIIKNR